MFNIPLFLESFIVVIPCSFWHIVLAESEFIEVTGGLGLK